MDGNTEQFTFTGRIRSIRYALHGVVEMLRSQHNAWVHLMATIVVVSAGFWCRVTSSEWCFLTLAIMSVWVAEALNTAFEFLCDVASPDFHPIVKKSKDVAAGAVLISAIGAVVIGAIVFLPHVTNLAATG